MSKLFFLFFSIAFSALSAFGDSTANLLASRVQSDLAALDTKFTLAEWIRIYPEEKLQLAKYGLEYEDQGRWCASTIASIRSSDGGEITRSAFFYPPPVRPGFLPWGNPGAIPEKERNFWGSASWNPLFTWQRKNETIWVSVDSAGLPGEGPRLLAFIYSQTLRSQPVTDDLPRGHLPLAMAAARIACARPRSYARDSARRNIGNMVASGWAGIPRD